MIRILLKAYDDEGRLVCHLVQLLEETQVPNWSEIEYQFEEELLQNLGESE